MNISVYITSYNQKEFFKEAIESVLSQTFMPYEIIVVDDASSDGSVELIKTYQSRYPDLIKTHFNSKNKGISNCRNLALSLVTGDYITSLDGDDVYLPNKLETQAQLVQASNATLVYTNFYFAQNEITNITGTWFQDTDELPQGKNVFKEVLSRRFPKGILFRYELVERNLLKDIGGYDEALKIYEDFDFRIRLTKQAKVSFSDKPLSIYRLHGDGLSRAPKVTHFQCLKYIFEKYAQDLLNFSLDDRKQIEEDIRRILSRVETPKKKVEHFIWLRRILRQLRK